MIFIDACLKKQTPYTPIWMMRQAGRYLKEYMAVRNRAGGFLNLCKDYKMASEVTIQPVEILDVDAAILFSDILVLPLEIGMDLEFIKGEGPVFKNPLKNRDDLKNLNIKKGIKNLSYVYDTIKLTRQKLPQNKALIGFCGAPWTVATYMIEGQGSKTYTICKKMLYKNPDFLKEILSIVMQATKIYLENQIKSGVNAIQIFDSWANALEEEAFFEFSWRYILEIVDYLKAKFPQIPIIVFPKGVGSYLDKIDGNFDVFGVDWSTPMQKATEILSQKYILQGNMEPCRLYDQKSILKGVTEICKIMKDKNHIFNLGHGILPDIPVENVKYFINLVKEMSAR